MEEPQLIESSKGGYKLKHRGYLYRYQKMLACGDHRWKCATAGAGGKCPGYAKTNSKAPDGLVVKSEGDHDHDAAPDAVQAAKIRNKLRAEVLGNPAITIHQALATSLPGASEYAMAKLPCKETLKRGARRAREAQKKAR